MHFPKSAHNSSSNHNRHNEDWLTEQLPKLNPCELPDILGAYIWQGQPQEEEEPIPSDIENNLVNLPIFSERHSFSRILTNKAKDIDTLTKILLHCKIFPCKKCRYFANKLISCFGNIEIAIKCIGNPEILQNKAGFDDITANIFKTISRYLLASALSYTTIASPATAQIYNEARNLSSKLSSISTNSLTKSLSRIDVSEIDSQIAATILAASGRLENAPKDQPSFCQDESLVTDRDILIGVWWVYWSMKRLRDNLASSGETSFLWDVLTKRTQNNIAWLNNIGERCVEGYEPEMIRMAIIPKSAGKERHIPAIALEDKVALMALYSSCYKDMERNDRDSADYACKYPSSEKIDSASSLNFVPRAFWYRYLNNYLKYTDSINFLIDGGFYVIQTDIASFVHSVEPELLLDSMRKQGYGREISNAIYRFHRGWNDQDSRIGIPFGSSLTTAGMKIILCRINAEMKCRGHKDDVVFNYADDFVVAGKTLEEAEGRLDDLDDVLTGMGLQRSQDKTHIRAPGSPPSRLSIETAIDDACSEAGISLYLGIGKAKPKSAAFDAPESLVFGGEIEPLIESNGKMATVPQCVLRTLYLKHVKPHIDRGETPENGIARYTLYRMIKCGMPETKEILLKIYRLCPHEQAKILGWLHGMPVLHSEILVGLVDYYKDVGLQEENWMDYSRSRFVNSICKLYEGGASISNRNVGCLLMRWWLDQKTGYLTRRELDHLVRVVRLSE